MAQNALIVDDSATMRKILMRGSREAGIGNAACEAAADGVEGMRAAEAREFDLVLTDLDMPNSNDLEFVTAVEDQPGTPPPISGPLRK